MNTASGGIVCRLCRVAGRVQGVSFRASAQHLAQHLGITGYARNLPGGRVEVLACGSPEAVAALCEWLRQGPALARVTAVECEDGTGRFPARFEVL